MSGQGTVPVRLAIVGGGPSCTYTLERLAATVPDMPDRIELDIHVFDKAGQFGAGAVHSAGQPETSFLNRIVGQVAFAADESVLDAGPLLPVEMRPTLLAWCRRKFAETGDPAFDLAAEDWPKRYVHGLALESQFHSYVELLRAYPAVQVHLHHDEVVNLADEPDGLRVVTASDTVDLVAQHVLMVTGHSTNDPAKFPLRGDWAAFAERHRGLFVPSAYPLERYLDADVVPPGTTVGTVGMGLTAIDVILHLTEGRGGTYERRADGRLRYVPSGAEPAAIVASSSAGLFTFARPFNAKERDLARFEHTGVFLTTGAVAALRASVGVEVRIGSVPRHQLDFERDVFPLVVLEMAHLYYVTLLGREFGDHLAERVRTGYAAFLAGVGRQPTAERAVEALLAPLEQAIDEAVEIVDGVLAGQRSTVDPALPSWTRPAVDRYITVVFGAGAAEQIRRLADRPAGLASVVAGLTSPWRHATWLAGNRFSWRAAITPIPADASASPQAYHAAMVEFMERDHLWAAQDNLTNPAKAAADGVWRDLRPVLGEAVDFGGLAARSHQRFLDVYMRHHNRLANGAALEVMEKILAVVEHGLVDVSIGPGARVETDHDTGMFVIAGPRTGARRPVDVLVDARVHPFDPEADTAPIYRALLRGGLIRKWHNPNPAGGPAFEPGGLDLTADFHPVRADGVVDDRLTFLGPPSEGVMFFQLGALRPNQNHHVMRDILCWLRSFWGHVGQRAHLADPLVTSTT
jgi:hypothetical protein